MAKQQQGPRGRRGIPGPRGPTGSAGATGHSGARGAKGGKGAKGAQGAKAPAHRGKARQRLILSLERHVENIYGELTVQMKRLGRIQAQVDELRAKVRRV